jgi:hypothetical protein
MGAALSAVSAQDASEFCGYGGYEPITAQLL